MLSAYMIVVSMLTVYLTITRLNGSYKFLELTEAVVCCFVLALFLYPISSWVIEKMLLTIQPENKN